MSTPKKVEIADMKAMLSGLSRGMKPGEMPEYPDDDEDPELYADIETPEQTEKRLAREKAKAERDAESQKVLDRIAQQAAIVEAEEAARVPEAEPERPESFGSWV